MIKAVIIEDELNSRELLHQMLTNYCEGVIIVGMADDIKSGINIIQEKNPDIVFLDIEMPGGTGFDILDCFKNHNFKLVFVTGYQEYAIKAIKYAAFDFILKPINLEELRQTIKRIKSYPFPNQNLQFLKDNMTNQPDRLNQFIISDNKKYSIVQFNDIILLEAERNYVTFHLSNHVKHMVTNSLNYYEELLPADCFFRVHRSYIINCKKVVQIDSGRGGNIFLSEDNCIPIAVRRKPALLRFLDQTIQ